MKQILLALFLVLCCAPAYAWTNGDGWLDETMIIPGGPALPSACADKQIFDYTSAATGRRFYICESGTWVQQGGSSGNTFYVTAPTSPSDTCTAGNYAADVNYYYICLTTDTWERTAIATWSVSASYLLLETSDFILQEDGSSKIQKES